MNMYMFLIIVLMLLIIYYFVSIVAAKTKYKCWFSNIHSTRGFKWTKLWWKGILEQLIFNYNRFIDSQ